MNHESLADLASRVEAGLPHESGDFSIGGTLWPGLSKLIEECGEVLQVGGKLIGMEFADAIPPSPTRVGKPETPGARP